MQSASESGGSNMHILILEAELIGHHAIYLEKVALSHLELGRKVTIVVSEKYSSYPSLLRIKQHYGASCQIETLSETKRLSAMNSRLGNIGREVGFWRIFHDVYANVAARQRVDYVFIPYLDYCLYAFGLLGSPFGKVRWVGVCMRPSFHFKKMSVVAPSSPLSFFKKWLFERVLRLPSVKYLFTIDQTLSLYYQQYPVADSSKLAYLPDPADAPIAHTKQAARASLGIPETATVILVYGALDSRKGIRNLVEGMLHKDAPQDLHLLVVGEQSEEIEQLLCSDLVAPLKRELRLHQVIGFVSDEQERLAFSASDIAWLGYLGHYTMSGVLVKAVQYGLVVLGANQGLIGWYIKQENLGVAIDVEDLTSVVNSLVWCKKHGGISDDLQRLWQTKHSWEVGSKLLVQL